ncbi:hypothetical protein ACP70R_040082 [Stipagrostis hirtigluma subsp. patula]
MVCLLQSALYCKTSGFSSKLNTIGSSIMAQLDNAIKKRGFSGIEYTHVRLVTLRSDVELKDTASAIMYYIEKYTGDLSDNNMKKLRSVDKEWLQNFKEHILSE